MIDDNVTAIIQYFVNETMKFNEAFDTASPAPHIYGHRINLTTDMVDMQQIIGTTSDATVATTGLPKSTTNPNRAASSSSGGGGSSNSDNFQNAVIIPLYAIIFGCCVIGNLFVILTLAQNKRMRTVTNVYLLNLVSTFFSFFFSFNKLSIALSIE